MSQKLALSSAPVGDVGPGGTESRPSFDPRVTVLSQYANSPVMLAVIDLLAEAFDQQDNLDQFYDLVWNVATAKGFGLDIWGRIVGVGRVLRIPASVPYFGFAEQPFGQGIFYGAGVITQNYALTDDAFRRLVFAKAALNINDGSIAAINAAMLAIFPTLGNSYVQDHGDMTMTYVFGSQPSPVELAIVAQAGVLPKPVGVSVSGEVAS